MLGIIFSTAVFHYQSPPKAANVNLPLLENWAFTREERKLLRHAVKNHKEWTYYDVPTAGHHDTRYFIHKSNIQYPVFCVQKFGSIKGGEPLYEFRQPWEDGQKIANFTDLLGHINTTLKKTLPSVKPDLSLIHNG